MKIVWSKTFPDNLSTFPSIVCILSENSASSFCPLDLPLSKEGLSPQCVPWMNKLEDGQLEEWTLRHCNQSDSSFSPGCSHQKWTVERAEVKNWTCSGPCIQSSVNQYPLLLWKCDSVNPIPVCCPIHQRSNTEHLQTSFNFYRCFLYLPHSRRTQCLSRPRAPLILASEDPGPRKLLSPRQNWMSGYPIKKKYWHKTLFCFEFLISC